jgi:RimJ/RimL family protein N-acetyltransferase
VKLFRIATARLRLRALAASDLALMRDVYSDAETMRFIGRPFSPALAAASLRATLQAMRQPEGPRFFAVIEKRSRHKIGLCSIQPVAVHERSAEIGIMLTREARRRRYASEALSALIAAAFQTLPIDTVWVQYRKANRGAARLFDALGFYETDGWRPRGARPRLFVRIVQRSLWRAQSNQPEGGSNVECHRIY